MGKYRLIRVNWTVTFVSQILDDTSLIPVISTRAMDHLTSVPSTMVEAFARGIDMPCVIIQN